MASAPDRCETLPRDDLAYPHGDAEPLGEPLAQLLGEPAGASREEVDVLGHSLRIAVGIHGAGAEQDDVGASTEEFQNLSEDRGERNFFVRHEFSEGERCVCQKRNRA